VREILFDANDRVELGQRLVQIDDRVEQADLAAAEAQLDLAQETLQRVEALRDRGIAPVSDLDIARADATNARAQVLKLTAVLNQKALEAPFDGVVGIPRIEVGEYVTPGTVYATLQDLDRMRVDFSIPEQQIRQIEIGMPVTAWTEVGGTELEGRIVAIEPKIDPNSRLVTVRAEVENLEGKINPGQFLNVRVELPAEDGVVALPQTVLSSTLYGDSVYILRTAEEMDDPAPAAEGAAAADGGQEQQPTLKAEQVFVQAGRRSEGLVEIVRGVEPGDRVVSAGQNKLSSGATVVIDNSVTPTPEAATN
jgi:membrane fusion protein, multidrug efflux system